MAKIKRLAKKYGMANGGKSIMASANNMKAIKSIWRQNKRIMAAAGENKIGVSVKAASAA